jgi:two-component system, OmpR family, response regulator
MQIPVIAGLKVEPELARMRAATTIIFAREDLSIPGAAEDWGPARCQTVSVEMRFFELVDRSKPDVLVLDLSSAPADGIDTILKIRGGTDIPILVVCDAHHSLQEEYRIAGAAGCIAAPIDIIRLNETIQTIIRVRGRNRASTSSAPENYSFAGMRLYPHRDLLAGENGTTANLTNSEGRLLAHLVTKPWTICTRGEIGELLYGPEHTVGDRAIDVIVNRLRKKLALVGGEEAEHLIKTEFRRGYLLVTDVATLPHEASAPPPAALASAG